jgi:hypothetical protein
MEEIDKFEEILAGVKEDIDESFEGSIIEKTGAHPDGSITIYDSKCFNLIE